MIPGVIPGDLARPAAIAIFAATYAVIAFGRLPGFRLDRAGAALIGASLMVVSGILDMGEAYRAVDLGTIVLLLGVMIVVANLRLSGFFALVAAAVARRAGHPLALLAGIVLVSGFFSAFLVNDTICLVLAPLVIELLRGLKRSPVPYLLAVAMASNVGSAATITGNPQNIMIGSFSGIPYGGFLAALAPVSLVGLAIVLALVAWAYRGEMTGRLAAPTALPIHANMPLVRKSAAITAAMVAAFFLVGPPAKVAIVAGALLLLTRRLKPERIYREIDWSLLLLFAGLFVVVAGAEKALLTPGVLAAADRLDLASVPVLGIVAAILSNLVSNVPAVLVLKSFVEHLADHRTAWLTLAMASTLAGNFTILGSVANLIVVERARRARVEIGFWTYFRLGAPVTVLTLLFGIWWLSR